MGTLIRTLFSRLFHRNHEYGDLEKSVSYRFKDHSLLSIALTHKSLKQGSRQNYERMEFLGDSIIESILSHWLYNSLPEADEGILTRQRSALVNHNFLTLIAYHIHLDKFIQVDKSVRLQDRKVLDNILSDVFEALIGAVFLDGGIRAAKKVVFHTIVNNAHLASYENNYKGLLIEYCHRNHLSGPQFIHHASNGPEHEKTFSVEVKVGPKQSFLGEGKSKKEAEQNSAKKALEKLR